MDLASVALHSSCSLSILTCSSISSRYQPPCISFHRQPTRSFNLCFKTHIFLGNHLAVNSIRVAKPCCAAFADGTTAVGETRPCSDVSTSTKIDDEPVSSDGLEDEKDGSDDDKMTRVCDKLIGVFMVDKPSPTDWRRLLAFSKEWDNIRPHFFNRCQERADLEDDPGMKHKLLRLARKLKEIDEDVQRHNELLQVIKKSPSELGEIVARQRKDFTKEFFVHLFAVAQSYHDNPTEQNALTKLGNDCVAAVQAYDSATESIDALNTAELKLQDIIGSPTLDAACRKIDDLANKNQLDPALVLMLTKAWSAAKESNMTKDEVKDVLYHLYVTARGNLQRQMPKEIRIVKHLLTIEDPEERLSSLRDAFTPGEELEGKDVDSLYTTPEKLHTWIKAVVEAYHMSREGTLLREARDLMHPSIIKKLEEMKLLVEKHFM